MSKQPARKGNGDTADDEQPPFHQRMHIKALPYPDIVHIKNLTAEAQRRRDSQRTKKLSRGMESPNV